MVCKPISLATAGLEGHMVDYRDLYAPARREIRAFVMISCCIYVTALNIELYRHSMQRSAMGPQSGQANPPQKTISERRNIDPPFRRSYERFLDVTVYHFMPSIDRCDRTMPAGTVPLALHLVDGLFLLQGNGLNFNYCRLKPISG